MSTEFKVGDRVWNAAPNSGLYRCTGIVIWVAPDGQRSGDPVLAVCWHLTDDPLHPSQYSVRNYTANMAVKMIAHMPVAEAKGRYMCVVPDSGREPKVTHCTEEEALAEAERLAAAHKLSCVRVVKVVATLNRKRITTYQNEWDRE